MEKDTNEVLGTKSRKHFLQKTRDLKKAAMVMADGAMFYLLPGVENQHGIDYAIPQRVLTYDAASYDRQVRELHEDARKKYEAKGGSGGKFAWSFPEGQTLVPVITLVLY